MNRTKFSFERFSLTPALSRWERENRPPTLKAIGNHRFRDSMREIFQGFQQFALGRQSYDVVRLADLEIGATAGLETCATVKDY